MDRLTFNDDLHEYRYDGKVIPSVTQIIKEAGLSDFGMVNPDLLLRAINFGKAVHKVIELDFKRTLDLESIDANIAPYLSAWDKFVKDFQYKPSCFEFRSMNEVLRIGYCIDSVGVIGEHSAMVDVKTGSPKPADIIQVCAYGKVYPSDRLLIVYLDEYEYKVYEIKRAERKKGEQIFIACLTVYNFKKTKGLL